MQIIQNIRDKGAAIVIGVIALSLIGFILMDANLGSSRSGANRNETLGTINGVDVENEVFASKVKQIEEQYGGRASGAQVYQIRQSAWDQMVAETVLGTEFDKLGLIFSPKELTSIIFSEDAPQQLKQAFTNKENGQYDLAKVADWWKNQAKKAKGEQKDALVSQIVDPLVLQTLYTKYSSLIAASGYYPTWMKDKEATENNTFANISYVAVPYTVINDSTVKVTDEDILTYVKDKKEQYKQDGGRQISYVSFSASPNGADSLAALKSVTDLKPAFTADSNATVFVTKNTSSKSFNDVFVPKAKVQGVQKDTLISLATNEVFGPYLEGKEYILAKKIATRLLPDSIKCRHILIGTVNRETGETTLDSGIAHKRIDSIAALIAGGANFDSLEAKFSTDMAAHKDKGVMTFDEATMQNKQQFAPEFGEFLLNEKGENRKVVKTNFGWHYIEILDRKNPTPAFKIAYFAKEIVTSPETESVASGKANKLSGEARNGKAFDEYVVKNKLENNKFEASSIVKENDYQLGGLQDARQLVKWAFEAKEGDVSEPMNIQNQYVVAMVKKIVPEGLPDATSLRPLVETLVRNKKKADQIKTKLTATPTLETAAAAYTVQIQNAGADSTLTFGAQIINGLGQEPKVIGASFNKAYQAKASEPIAGNSGVYVIKVNGTAVKATQTAEEIAKKTEERAKNLSQQMGSGFFESLRKQAVIKDKRSKIY
jgi:peptidyl-prolyl cis-trans isomerase D